MMRNKIMMETKKKCLRKMEHYGVNPEEEQNGLDLYKGYDVYYEPLKPKKPVEKEEFCEKIIEKFEIILDEQVELVETSREGINMFNGDKLMFNLWKKYKKVFNYVDFDLDNSLSEQNSNSDGDFDDDDDRRPLKIIEKFRIISKEKEEMSLSERNSDCDCDSDDDNDGGPMIEKIMWSEPNESGEKVETAFENEDTVENKFEKENDKENEAAVSMEIEKVDRLGEVEVQNEANMNKKETIIEKVNEKEGNENEMNDSVNDNKVNENVL
ncbi:hypothetical protein Tco_1293222 [Tanacetum coccineum]